MTTFDTTTPITNTTNTTQIFSNTNTFQIYMNYMVTRHTVDIHIFSALSYIARNTYNCCERYRYQFQQDPPDEFFERLGRLKTVIQECPILKDNWWVNDYLKNNHNPHIKCLTPEQRDFVLKMIARHQQHQNIMTTCKQPAHDSQNVLVIDKDNEFVAKRKHSHNTHNSTAFLKDINLQEWQRYFDKQDTYYNDDDNLSKIYTRMMSLKQL
eukprot:254120_1